VHCKLYYYNNRLWKYFQILQAITLYDFSQNTKASHSLFGFLPPLSFSFFSPAFPFCSSFYFSAHFQAFLLFPPFRSFFPNFLPRSASLKETLMAVCCSCIDVSFLVLDCSRNKTDLLLLSHNIGLLVNISRPYNIAYNAQCRHLLMWNCGDGVGYGDRYCRDGMELGTRITETRVGTERKVVVTRWGWVQCLWRRSG